MNSGVQRLARIKALTKNPVKPGQERGLGPLGGRLVVLAVVVRLMVPIRRGQSLPLGDDNDSFILGS